MGRTHRTPTGEMTTGQPPTPPLDDLPTEQLETLSARPVQEYGLFPHATITTWSTHAKHPSTSSDPQQPNTVRPRLPRLRPVPLLPTAPPLPRRTEIPLHPRPKVPIRSPRPVQPSSRLRPPSFPLQLSHLSSPAGQRPPAVHSAFIHTTSKTEQEDKLYFLDQFALAELPIESCHARSAVRPLCSTPTGKAGPHSSGPSAWAASTAPCSTITPNGRG